VYMRPKEKFSLVTEALLRWTKEPNVDSSRRRSGRPLEAASFRLPGAKWGGAE